METEKEIEARIRSIKGKISDLEIQLRECEKIEARFDQHTPEAEVERLGDSIHHITMEITEYENELNQLLQ